MCSSVAVVTDHVKRFQRHRHRLQPGRVRHSIEAAGWTWNTWSAPFQTATCWMTPRRGALAARPHPGRVRRHHPGVRADTRVVELDGDALLQRRGPGRARRLRDGFASSCACSIARASSGVSCDGIPHQGGEDVADTHKLRPDGARAPEPVGDRHSGNSLLHDPGRDGRARLQAQLAHHLTPRP